MNIEQAKHILSTFYKNKETLKGNTEALRDFQKAKVVFTKHYSDNPKAFIEDYLRILDGNTNVECAFYLNEAQNMVIEGLKAGHRYLACPKSRQVGLTTLSNALALHHTFFRHNANTIVMAYKMDNANENLKRIKTMFKTAPDWVQWLMMEWDEKDGHANNVSLWSFKSKITGTNNKLETASASTTDATRGKTPTMLHFTEVAFSDMAEDIWTSIFPALNRRNDSLVILESTGNGTQGLYYDICTGKKKGFEVIFMPWHIEKNYQEEGTEVTEDDRYYIAELMGVTEIPDHLSDAQLAWFRTTSHTIGKSKCQQEFPIDVHQVFQATNSSFFSVKTMQSVTVEEPKNYLTLEGGYLTTRPSGPGIVFEEPLPEYEYLISCDSSEGQVDPSVVSILNPKGEEVLFWREKLVPEDLVKLLDTLGKRYNYAKVVVENNGVGHYVVNTLLQTMMYPNVYYHDGKPGMRTTHVTKPTMLATLQDYILQKKLKYRNPNLSPEMSTFEADTLKAVKGQFDDTVLSCAIGAYAFRLEPPKMKYVQDNYYDYTREVYPNTGPKRRFIM